MTLFSLQWWEGGNGHPNPCSGPTHLSVRTWESANISRAVLLEEAVCMINSVCQHPVQSICQWNSISLEPWLTLKQLCWVVISPRDSYRYNRARNIFYTFDFVQFLLLCNDSSWPQTENWPYKMSFWAIVFYIVFWGCSQFSVVSEKTPVLSLFTKTIKNHFHYMK